jgi:NADPH-dependent glutamate synthase beta subunit-like oxidoreductase/NAD(P)H-flavin reductase
MNAPTAACGLPTPEDLYSRPGLERLDARFDQFLRERDPALAMRLAAARAGDGLARREESELWLALAPFVDEFLGALFSIGAQVAELIKRQDDLEVVFEVRRKFVQRHIAKKANGEAAAGIDGDEALEALEAHLQGAFEPIRFARAVRSWLEREPQCRSQLAAAERFVTWATLSPEGRRRFGHHALFHVPHKHDPLKLVATSTRQEGNIAWLEAPAEQPLRQRRGFGLTDAGYDLAGAMGEIHYCIYCHHQDKDSCSSGLRAASGSFEHSAVGAPQTGCPLGERISEMHEAKRRGHVLSALAIACLDNPMLAGTGHRICNDCMVSCIYQKQHRDPVNIPQAETRILKDVLELPWGFEIYSLLTRWNPLNFRRPLPRPPSGRSVLIVGAGPAGYTLAHHLLNDGHAVALIDGLKIEPLPPELSGRDGAGNIRFDLIRRVDALRESLAERVSAGFGGVAEYGITVRWDKNFLKILRLLLERRAQFALLGALRFGGALGVEDAFALGFDHIALCMGAGRPTLLEIPNGLARGVRQASDFLMALQLTGAARTDTLANLQMRLPVVVIGGGLTAIDTCTEALAYYPVQVERFLTRYESLCARFGAEQVRGGWTEQDRSIAEEFLQHAHALRAERAAAEREGREPDIVGLLRSWGGARILYRRVMRASPAYKNHEEIIKALEEGIAYAENLQPLAVQIDRFGHACGLSVRDTVTGAEATVPARTVLIAAGTVPNTVLAAEAPALRLDGNHFQAYDEHGTPVSPERCGKPAATHVIAHLAADGRAISFFGDLHPSFAGTVVKAMASAKNGYPIVSRLLERVAGSAEPSTVLARLRAQGSARVVRVERLTATIVEVVVEAPLAARAFRPGQFFRLQNYEAGAPRICGTRLAMEGIALTGAWVDPALGHVGLVALEMGGSSSLCTLLQPGEPVALMGPTGEPTHIPRDETVVLIGGGLGNAVLVSIGRAMRACGCRVLYFAGYRSSADVFKRQDLEAAADVLVWCADSAPAPRPGRPQDRQFVGNVVQALEAYAAGRLGEPAIALEDVDRIIAIGSEPMMAAVAAARRGGLAARLKRGHVALASINSPMQCMMKAICAQCLQSHRDPTTGIETIVFTCLNQDQEMDRVDFAVLRQRLGQNSLQEKLTARWINACREQASGGATAQESLRSDPPL